MQGWVTWVVLGAFFVLMIVMTIIPQRKQKKQQEQMMNSLGVGSKIMTIGGYVGTIVAIDGNNFHVNIGAPGQDVVVVIVRNAVRQSLDAPQQQAAVAAKKEEEKKDDNNIYTIPAPTDEQIAELSAKEEKEAAVVEPVVEAEVVEEAVVVEEKAAPVKKAPAKKAATKKTTKK